MLSRTMKALARFGRPGERFGPTVPPTKARFVPTCCHCKPRGRAMLEAILAWNAMTLICGRMNLRFLNQPGQIEIQSDIFYDYRTNVENYPRWQAWMREKQPRLLVIWGKYEASL